MDVQQEFWRRLKQEWLPAYCDDPARRYSVEGFSAGKANVTDNDARNFLRALDYKIISVDSGGKFRMPQSKTHEVIFWEHSKKVTPRPITLWLEPVITIAAVARLHLDYGWPIESIGMQSDDWAFDVVAYDPNELSKVSIAGEVKPTSKQLDTLVANIKDCCWRGEHDDCLTTSRKNAHRKVVGLRRCCAPLFWAVGPGGDSRVFRVIDLDDYSISLTETDVSNLRYDS